MLFSFFVVLHIFLKAVAIYVWTPEPVFWIQLLFCGVLGFFKFISECQTTIEINAVEFSQKWIND